MIREFIVWVLGGPSTVTGTHMMMNTHNHHKICLQPEKYLWIIGQKNCETSTMRRRMCANAQHWIESGDLQKVKIFWVKYFLCRGLGTPEEWRGLDSYYYSIIIVNIIITLVTTSKRVIWDYENPLTIYIWNQQKTGRVKLACLYFL